MEPRRITPAEAAAVDWLLEHAPIDVRAYRTTPTAELRVVGGCGCGCASIDFDEDYSHEGIITDGLAVYPDGMQAGVILWGRDGVLVGIEIYSMDPVEDRFPAP